MLFKNRLENVKINHNLAVVPKAFIFVCNDNINLENLCISPSSLCICVDYVVKEPSLNCGQF